MNTYASTYISGLGEPITEWLKETYNNEIKIMNNYDGLIIYETKKDIINTPFFNNSFLVIGYTRGGGIH